MALSVISFAPPSGNVVPARHGSDFNAPFVVRAEFSGDCGNGEYRQYVRGTFKANGTPVMHVLCESLVLSPTDYREDGCPPNGCTAYGYRRCPQHPYDRYLPDQASGCQFEMTDAPGFRNISAGNYSIDLSFEGKLINTATGAVLTSATWTTSGSTTVSATPEAAASVAPSSGDRLVGAYLRVADSGSAELHIVFTRPAGRPPFDASAMGITLIDASGRRKAMSQSPSVHEAGNRSRSTVSVVYALPASVTAPVFVEVALDKVPVQLKVDRR